MKGPFFKTSLYRNIILFLAFIIIFILIYAWKIYNDFQNDLEASVVRQNEFILKLNDETLDKLQAESSRVLEKRHYNGRAEFSDDAVSLIEKLYDQDKFRFTVAVLLRVDDSHILYIAGDSAVKAYYITESLKSFAGELYIDKKDYSSDIFSASKRGYSQILNAKCLYDSKGEFRGLVTVSKWLKDRNAQNYGN